MAIEFLGSIPRCEAVGRKARLSETQRAGLWAIFEKVRAGLDAKGLITQSMMFTRLAVKLSVAKNLPFAFAVVRRRMWASGNFGSSRRCAASLLMGCSLPVT